MAAEMLGLFERTVVLEVLWLAWPLIGQSVRGGVQDNGSKWLTLNMSMSTSSCCGTLGDVQNLRPRGYPGVPYASASFCRREEEV
jgi:hypothetical protein